MNDPVKRTVTLHPDDFAIFEALAFCERMKVHQVINAALAETAARLRIEEPGLVRFAKIVRHVRRMKERGWSIIEGEG
jgi:hypothetical protein